MCDQTVVQYRPNDIVWVKVSSLWWPGEVVDKNSVEEDFTANLKKPPLALVKFFNEDTYEFPRDYDQICLYNCSKKDEFIMKGCHGSKRDKKMLEQFLKDIKIAEQKTGGDPDFALDPKFHQEEKYDYRQDFGLKPVNKAKASVQKERNRGSISTSSPGSAHSSLKVTCKSLPNKNIIRLNKKRNIPKIMLTTPIMKMEESVYDCIYCDYITRRSDNILWHMNSHYAGVNMPPPPIISTPYLPVSHGGSNEKPVETSKTAKTDKISSKKNKKLPNDVLTPVEEKIVCEKDRIDSSPAKKQKSPKDVKSSLVALDLLQDWDDDSNGDTQSNDDNMSISENKHEVPTNSTDPIPLPKTSGKSCFDFEDNEDVISVDHSLKFGQKLPRVISDKSPTTSKLKRHENMGENLLKDVDKFLESTKMPALPEIPKSHT